MAGQIAVIKKYLRERGWKLYQHSWWFKPLPEWNGRIASNQRLYGLSEAFDIERRGLEPVDNRSQVSTGNDCA